MVVSEILVTNMTFVGPKRQILKTPIPARIVVKYATARGRLRKNLFCLNPALKYLVTLCTENSPTKLVRRRPLSSTSAAQGRALSAPKLLLN